MASSADDFDEVHLPVDITIETYDTLLLLMSSNEPNVLMPTISALRERVTDESVVNSVISRIVELAGSYKNDQVLTVISWFLAALANSACKEKWAFELLSSSKSVPYIVNFSRQFDVPSIYERCFEALVSLANDPITSREIIANGALDAFKDALKRDDPTVQTQVSLALFRMSTDFENRRAMLSSGLFDSMIDFLASEDLDEEILGNALQATGNILADPDCVVHFEERAGWNSVYQYLEDNDKTIQTYAYNIIAKISTVQSFHYHFDEELLNKFLTALNDLDESDPVVPYLLVIFKNCCGIPIVSKALAQQIPFLLDRLYSAQTEVSQKETMAEILANLGSSPNTHSALLESDQLSRICKLMDKEITTPDGVHAPSSKTIIKCAILVLDAVCDNRSVRGKLHEFGAIERLIAILHQAVTGKEPEPEPESQQIQSPVAQTGKLTAAEKSAIEKASQEKAAQEAVTEKIAAQIPPAPPEKGNEKGWSVEMQMIILPMIYKMIGDAKLQHIIIEKGMSDIEILIESEYPDILNTTLLILATIAIDDVARTDIAARPHFMQVLINLVSNKKVAIRRNSLHAINSLAMKPEIAIQLCGFGLIEKLKKFASSSQMINLNLSAFATTALETLCQSNVIAKFWVKDILDFGDVINDGFYSIDPRSESYKSLDALLSDVIHLRIEALLLDQSRDPGLKDAVQSLADSFTVKVEQPEANTGKKKTGKKNEPMEPQVTVVIPEWPHVAKNIAQFVISRMGGPFEGGRIPYEAEVSRSKYKTHSDVVMLGQLQVGAVRHRALLFKYLGQKYGMEVLIKRNREDLSCEVNAKKGGDIYKVNLTGDTDILTVIQLGSSTPSPDPKEAE